MIRRLREADIESLVAVRREALLADPAAFSASLETDAGLDPELLRAAMRPSSAQAFFGAFDPELVGIAGVHQHQREKEAHKASLSGMYVRTDHRRQGLGRALLGACIEFARSLPGVTHLHLAVSADARPAVRLYQKTGFETWGTEPVSLRVEGLPVTVHHMVLRLSDAAS